MLKIGIQRLHINSEILTSVISSKSSIQICLEIKILYIYQNKLFISSLLIQNKEYFTDDSCKFVFKNFTKTHLFSNLSNVKCIAISLTVYKAIFCQILL